MLKRIRWSPEAADDLESIHDYIARDNPPAAKVTVYALHEACLSLKTMPERGRPGRIRGSRELILSPYIIAYRIVDEFVEISRIWHAAQEK